MTISIIMPVLNEAAQIQEKLSQLKITQPGIFEIIVVDGGSSDNSLEYSLRMADRVLVSGRGRALQMNAGALQARGDIFLFLHADTSLPVNVTEVLSSTDLAWGYFDIQLSGQHFMFRIIECMINIRSRLTHVATGDQAMFVSRELFEKIGGFPELELMEDVAMSKLLRKHAAPLCIRQPVTTSSRRWQQRGILKTIMLMWWLRLLYFSGVSPSRLAQLYR